ncbi:hypothetical protein ACFYRJ_29700 [Streptomyces sp. NPDC005531]|uniref:hypothetical protein n=1 Tax=unclassified Streptomyces TaxID=2593676 RepID=UPI0036BEE7A5
MGLPARFAHRFGRSETRERALGYLEGLIAPLEKKNGWTLSEQVGQLRTDGVQRLLNTSVPTGPACWCGRTRTSHHQAQFAQ